MTTKTKKKTLTKKQIVYKILGSNVALRACQIRDLAYAKYHVHIGTGTMARYREAFYKDNPDAQYFKPIYRAVKSGS